jgi:hypothetical protein
MPLITRGKLTKRFFMSLEAGRYLVSNVYEQTEGGRNVPCFRDTVSPPEAREEQWSRIKSAYADGRECAVLACEADYEAYTRSLPVPNQ